jgi:catechol 2,3-dioxygenase-like lactoylglutathione lyase family enzyme
MLTNNSVIAFIPTSDAARSREFYERTLGLRFVSDDSFAVVMDCRGTMLRIARVGKFTPHPFTILGWEVEDMDKTAEVMAGNGVKFEVFPGLQQDEAGVWTAPGGVKVAWFKDPDGNILSISQHSS